MFDSIEIISILLFIGSFFIALLGLKDRQIAVAITFLISAILPLLWAGLVRFPIPQTLIWMGVNIFAILLILQGILNLFIHKIQNPIINWPSSLTNAYKGVLGILIGFGYASIIILARF